MGIPDYPAHKILGLSAGLFAVVVLFVAIMALIGYLWWQGSWFFANQDAARNAHLVQNNFSTQEGYLAAISNDVTQLDGVVVQEPGSPDAPALRAQALGIGDQACLEASYLTGSVPVPATTKTWIRVNCSAGTVSLSSPIRTGGN